MTNRTKSGFTSHCRIAAKSPAKANFLFLLFPTRFAHARYSSRMIDRFLNWCDHGKPKSGKLKGRCQSQRRWTSCCCCSQPASRMLATVLEWLRDFLTEAIMESRKAARSKVIARVLQRRANFWCCSQPVLRMLATVLGWLGRSWKAENGQDQMSLPAISTPPPSPHPAPPGSVFHALWLAYSEIIITVGRQNKMAWWLKVFPVIMLTTEGKNTPNLRFFSFLFPRSFVRSPL